MTARTDEDRFLSEILAAPGDDAPRRVFADWLAERGSPRGEFIHIQCELARIALTDDRREALLAREQELQLHHAQSLAGPFYHPDIAFQYHRGLPVRFGHAGYFSTLRDDSRHVQRFFLDRRIIAVSTTNDARPEQLARWFGHDYEDHGQYTLTVDLDAGGLALSYASTSSYGTVK